MSKRDELLTSCRYYKGENENPYKDGNKALFWEYEKNWLDMFLDESQTLIEYRDEYVKDGLLDFESKDDVPTTLKAMLYNRFLYWLEGSPTEFKKFYNEQYLGQI
jgi:hypothetical protein